MPRRNAGDGRHVISAYKTSAFLIGPPRIVALLCRTAPDGKFMNAGRPSFVSRIQSPNATFIVINIVIYPFIHIFIIFLEKLSFSPPSLSSIFSLLIYFSISRFLILPRLVDWNVFHADYLSSVSQWQACRSSINFQLEIPT